MIIAVCRQARNAVNTVGRYNPAAVESKRPCNGVFTCGRVVLLALLTLGSPCGCQSPSRTPAGAALSHSKSPDTSGDNGATAQKTADRTVSPAAPASQPSADVSTADTGIADEEQSPAPEIRRYVRSALQAPPPGVRVERDIVYRTANGLDLRLDVYRLRVDAAGGRPAVIFIHGGGWRMGDKNQSRVRFVELAERGYVVFSINYRLSGQAVFPACVEDCKAAVRWVRANAGTYNVDGERIGLWGASAGAHLAALMAVSSDAEFRTADRGDQSSRVSCVVAYFGVYDLRDVGDGVGANLVQQLMGGSESQRRAAYWRASPLAYVEALIGRRIPPPPGLGPLRRAASSQPVASAPVTTTASGEAPATAPAASAPSSAPVSDIAPFLRVERALPAFLFIHGDADRVVHVSQSRRMHRALREAGAESELIVVRGGVHGLLIGRMDPPPSEFRRRTQEFLERHLKPAND